MLGLCLQAPSITDKKKYFQHMCFREDENINTIKLREINLKLNEEKYCGGKNYLRTKMFHDFVIDM